MNKSNKYVCIHGHFYQPPRENAWLEEVEMQDSAAPFHDWNERINFECYAPNTAARILDGDGFIRKIINNYKRISFNFGPTLLSWMEKADPTNYRAIINADRQSRDRFSGHGNALAQVHSHLIVPLCNPRDKRTQVIWGMRDFEHRFGRKAEGIWLAETAADTDTLEVLAEEGILYTILAPRQAKAFRKIGDKSWTSTSEAGIDPRRPYLCKLPSGKSIALFFYDGNIAQDVAFNGLLNNGKSFASRLLEGFTESDEPQLVHIATDGESYGHHHRYGEMALASCLNYIEENGLAVITNYAEFLEKFPPTFEAQIHDNSSWSCVHGVERWRSNCGCHTGGRSDWTQAWRTPLREALDWLRDQLVPIFEKQAGEMLNDPWQARNDYIDILLDRKETRIQAFVEQQAKRELTKAETTHLMRLMEMQRNAILMYTSCGWFFDEISGIETNQILQYALRAIHYAQQVSGKDFHPKFLKQLEKAPSNVYENGATAYKNYVVPTQVGLTRAGMHYAASSLFERYPEQLSLFNYEAVSEVFERIIAGTQRLAVGRAVMKSKITLSEKQFSFAVLYLGQQNIIGNIATDMDRDTFDQMKKRITEAFRSTNLGDVIAIMQEYFGKEKYTIWHLFRDEKRKILEQITDQSMRQAENTFRDIYNDSYQLMTGILRSGIPVPVTFTHAVQHVINVDLQRFFQQERLNPKELRKLASEMQKWNVTLADPSAFALAAGERIFLEIQNLKESDITLEQLQILNEIFDQLAKMNVEVDIWQSQNFYFYMMKGFKAGKWVFASEDWQQAFQKLGDHLRIRA